jgi:D-sedoheptulose 7-phosphate isomerase
MESILNKLVAESCATMQSLLTQAAKFEQIANTAVATLKGGGKLLTCGNGGSAADAMHLAEELVGRYNRNRRSLPAICLNADPTLLTCIANDFSYDEVFARQVEGLGNKGDLLICFTTSGNSGNVLRAFEAAKTKGVKSVALLGKGGGKAKGKADLELIVSSDDTARVQEAHTLLLHALLERIERELVPETAPAPRANTKKTSKTAPAASVAFFRQVLVVEDDYELASLLNEVLTFENCTVDLASNGMEGLEKLRSGNYDAVVCDLMLPLLDGESLYQQAIKQSPAMAERFLFITGQASRQAGFTDFIRRSRLPLLEKPFEVDTFREAIREVFAR